MSEYPVNRGIGKPVEFKGLKSQYLFIFCGGLLAVFVVFIVLFMAGVNQWLCIGFIVSASLLLVWQTFRLNAKYGTHGLMKAAARKKTPTLHYQPKGDTPAVQLQKKKGRKNMRNMLKATTLERKFPLLAVENGCIISKDADITVAFRVELPELFTVTSAEYEAIHSAWYKAVKVLPDYSIVHKQDFFIKENYQPDTERDELSFLSRSFERHFNERPFLNHYCYLFLTKDDKGEKPPTERLLHPLPGAGLFRRR